jgi:acetolactate synthase small subunit
LSIKDIELKFREDWESIKIMDNEEIIDLLTLLDRRMGQLEKIVDYLKTKNPLLERTLDDELELLDVQKQFISDEIDRAEHEVKSSYKDKQIIKEYKAETIRKLQDEYRIIQKKRETYEGQTQIRAPQTQTPLTELPPLTEQLLEPAGARETVARAGQVPGQGPAQGGGGIDIRIVTQILREITKIIPSEKKENTDKIIELATKLIENNYTVKKASVLSDYYLERFKLSAKSLEIIKDKISESPFLKPLIIDIVTYCKNIILEYNKLLKEPTFETDAILINLKDNVETYMSIFNTIITNVNEVYTELYKDIKQIMNKSFKIISSDQPSDHMNQEIMDLLNNMSSEDFGKVDKLLFLIQKLSKLNSFGTGILDERAVCGDVDGKKIDGKVCIEIIRECLSGPGEKCIDAFSKLNLDNGIELRTMDYAIAEQISRQIGFHDKSVAQAITDIKAKNPKFSINSKLYHLLEAIKARISDVTTKHYTTAISTPRIRNIPLRDINQRRIGLTGGGISMDYYNKFIINVDALKSNLVMKGGGNSVLLKQNIHYLTTLLKNNDKEIAEGDLNSINRLIDTVQVGEEKLKKIKDVIDGFITALNIKKIDISDIQGDPKDPKKVSFDMLTELKDKATKTQGKTLQKVSTCIGLFDFILPQLTSFIVQG